MDQQSIRVSDTQSYFRSNPSTTNSHTSAQRAEQIGWHQAVKGFLMTSWASAAAIHPTKPRLVQRDREQHRISRIIAALQDFTNGLWKDCNNVLHKHADVELKRIRSLNDSKIRHYHARPHLLPPEDRHYCEYNLNDIMERNPSVRRRWLLRVNAPMLPSLNENASTNSLYKKISRRS
jgi:hypothetical protein